MPLPLREKLEQVARVYDTGMTTIVVDLMQLHLPKIPPGQLPGLGSDQTPESPPFISLNHRSRVEYAVVMSDLDYLDESKLANESPRRRITTKIKPIAAIPALEECFERARRESTLSVSRMEPQAARHLVTMGNPDRIRVLPSHYLDLMDCDWLAHAIATWWTKLPD